MNRAIVIATFISLSVSLAAGKDAPAPASAATARAELKDAAGKSVGTATFTEQKDGVLINLEVAGLKPGKHGIHIHAVGKCEAPDFKSAGPHFNPANKKHGHDNPEGAHGGDLPNLEVGADGKGRVSLVAPGVTLAAGASSLMQRDGTALVLHADPDDLKTDPSGNSGARIACGLITK